MARGEAKTSFEQGVKVAQVYASLTPGAREIVDLLARLPEALNDPLARGDARGFLNACDGAGFDPVGVDRVRLILASFEGVLGEDGDETESVRRVA